MRVRGQSVATNFLAETIQLILGQATFEIGALIDTGRGVTLDKYQVAAMPLGWRTPEVIETHFIQCGRRRVT